MTSVPPATAYERALYVGIVLQGILYGIELILYLKTMHIYLARRRNPRKTDIFYAVFSTAMFIVVTIWIAITSILGQKMWLSDRTYPGGPMAFVTGKASSVFWHFMSAVTIVLQQMTDGLMVYRCRIVWDSSSVIIIPSFLWFANLVTGITSAAMTGLDPFSGISAQLSLAFYTSSNFLSTTLTCMICYRLLQHARIVRECLGEESASPYFIIITLIVESVLPYTLTGITFLVFFGMMSWVGTTMSCIYTLMMCISPQMLILRVAGGNAWQDTFAAPASVIKFAPGGGTTSRSSRFDREGAIAMHTLETLPSTHHSELVEDSDKV